MMKYHYLIYKYLQKYIDILPIRYGIIYDAYKKYLFFTYFVQNLVIVF